MPGLDNSEVPKGYRVYRPLSDDQPDLRRVTIPDNPLHADKLRERPWLGLSKPPAEQMPDQPSDTTESQWSFTRTQGTALTDVWVRYVGESDVVLTDAAFAHAAKLGPMSVEGLIQRPQ